MRFWQDGKGYLGGKSVDKMCLIKPPVGFLSGLGVDRD